jgi:K+-sensing histidine kinase KdpD
VLFQGMERILVPVARGKKDIWLIIHGMQLAERIGGTVYILEIDQFGEGRKKNTSSAAQRVTGGESGWAANTGRKEVKSEYFQVKGEFCDEIMKFCRRYRITNLVLDLTPVGKIETPERMLNMINSLKNSNGCNIELIGRKHERG